MLQLMLSKQFVRMWGSYIWLKIWSNGALLWTRQWIFRFRKKRWISPPSDSRRIL